MAGSKVFAERIPISFSRYITPLALPLATIGKLETCIAGGIDMMYTESGGFEEQPRHQFNSTRIFAGPKDGLSQTQNGVSTFVGLQGHSQKAGYRVIFPPLDMGRYVEIAEADNFGNTGSVAQPLAFWRARRDASLGSGSCANHD